MKPKSFFGINSTYCVWVAVKPVCFDSVFMLRVQDDFSALIGQVLYENLFFLATILKMLCEWVLQNDNDPKHTSKTTKQW